MFDPAQDIVDTFCVEPDFGDGMRYSDGISPGDKIGIGLGVGVGGSLIILLFAAAAFFAMKYTSLLKTVSMKR